MAQLTDHRHVPVEWPGSAPTGEEFAPTRGSFQRKLQLAGVHRRVVAIDERPALSWKEAVCSI
jgi:hypothetical protein